MPNYAQPWCAALPHAQLSSSQQGFDCASWLSLKDALVRACRQMRPQRSTSGSAFVIDTESRWIMTNAHVVGRCTSCSWTNSCHLLRGALGWRSPGTSACTCSSVQGPAFHMAARHQSCLSYRHRQHCCSGGGLLGCARCPMRQQCMCGDRGTPRSGGRECCARQKSVTWRC